MARRKIALAVVILALVAGFSWRQRASHRTEDSVPPSKPGAAAPAPAKPPPIAPATAPAVPAPDKDWQLVGTLTEDGEALTLEKRGDERRVLRRDGTTHELFTEVDGKREGTSTRWFPSGNVHSTGAWRAGKQEGTWTYFQDDGSIAQKGDFSSGAREGPWESWYPNGLVRWRGTYEQGRQVGPWTFVQPTGEVDAAQSGRYENGKKVGN
ncbi:MAG TPA: hypothetical protein VM509_01425 [Planctomycetota bacterium]|nr:hypothetical protein [Planctomycetota bacterium]